MPESMHCAVLGSPVEHSLSPVLHRAAYRQLGLDWTYDAYEVAEAELDGFMGRLTKRWRGLSVTMPLKRAVIELCDVVEERGRMLASVNTVVIDAGGARTGYNTDVSGFVGAFREAGVTSLDSVVVVGAGATAASALAAASDLGARRVTVLARSLSRAGGVASLGPALGLHVELRELSLPLTSLAADAVVSTIPADSQRPVAAALARIAPVVFDVIYHPSRTPLTEAAAGSAGVHFIDGFSLLLHQAARQVELMTGTARAPLQQMREAGLTALRSR